ncbi:TetR/AcrR family transcriptional regulator [Streptomyces sp. NRAIS4]
MSEPVKPDLRAARIAETEAKILRAAGELFLRDGYSATSLAAIADHALVGHRTVYSRFGNKATLLKRAVDDAFTGDTGREWFTTAGTAPTLVERITALAAGVRQMMDRAGDILSVALEAAAVEPELAAAAQAGRENTRQNIRQFLAGAADDGLLAPGTDLDWLTDTVALLVHAETYLLARKMIGWDLDGYQRWLTASLTALISGQPLP